MSKDYYETLGVNKSSSEEEIKKAYRKLVMQYHPDRNQGNKEAEQKLKDINIAYEVLGDKQKKAAYDQYGHNAFTQQSSHGGRPGGGFENFTDINSAFEDIFDMFGGGGRRKARSQQQQGSDLRYDVRISLEEAFHGTKKNISFRSMSSCTDCSGMGSKDQGAVVKCSQCNGSGTVYFQQGFFQIQQTCNICGGAGQSIKNPCKKCSGSGRAEASRSIQVVIPAGIANGTKIRIAGEGEAGIRAGKSGDLYVFVTVAEHNVFSVNGSDLYCKLPVSFTTAILGGEAELTLIDRAKISVKIPQGSQYGSQIKLSNLGMPIMNRNARGSLYIELDIRTPKSVSNKQRELLEALHNELNKNDSEGFIEKIKNFWAGK